MGTARIYRTRIFHSGALRGNRAAVALLSGPPDAAQMADIAGDSPEPTCCIAWPDARGVQVRCSRRGAPIRFCGHGLLATAAIWYQLCGECPRLCTELDNYTTRQQQGRIWLLAPRIATAPAPIPESAGRWFGGAPLRSAVTAAADGYRILEFGNGIDIAVLKPAFLAIQRHETRAVIITQTASTRYREFDYALRYFAPQYGTPEDDATGSAAVVLADYWSARLGNHLRALQCSAGGGAITSSADRGTVAISGEFELIG